MPLSPLYIESARGQCAILLLAALRELYVVDGFRNVTKSKAIRFITMRHWFAINDEDTEPYPSQRFATPEPRWHTLIAWARKDSVLRDLISYEARDAWGLTRQGRDRIERFEAACSGGARPLARCFLWSIQFKTFLNPAYVSGPDEASRPVLFYRDMFSKIFADF